MAGDYRQINFPNQWSMMNEMMMSADPQNGGLTLLADFPCMPPLFCYRISNKA